MEVAIDAIGGHVTHPAAMNALAKGGRLVYGETQMGGKLNQRDTVGPTQPHRIMASSVPLPRR